MLLLSLLLFATPSIEFQSKVRLDHPGAKSLRSFVDPSGNVWLWDYQGVTLHKFSPEGKELLVIDDRKHSPVSLHRTGKLSFLEDQLIVLNQDRLLAFDPDDGTFGGKIHDSASTVSLLQWDANHLLTVFSGRSMMIRIGNHELASRGLGYDRPDENVYIVNADGKIVGAWQCDIPTPPPPGPPSSKSISLIWNQKHLLHLAKAQPVILVWELGKARYDKWRLKPPSGYLIPPLEDLDPSLRYKKDLVAAFFDSYSQISGMVFSEKKLFVSWYMGKSRGFKLDAYLYPQRQQVMRDFEIPGVLIGIHKNTLYILEDQDTEEINYWLHRYTIKEKSS